MTRWFRTGQGGRDCARHAGRNGTSGGRHEKRIISLILAAVLCIGLLPATALADAAQNASAPNAQAEQNEPAAPVGGENGADSGKTTVPTEQSAPAAPQSTEDEASEQEGGGETVENPEAEINGKLYERLFDALDEVKTGDTIKLLNNIDHYYENIVIKGGTYTLDLNGYEIEVTILRGC